MNSLLQLKNLTIGYSGLKLIAPFSLTLPQRVRVGIIGGNGSGKSTFVKTILGVIPALAGSYQWDPAIRFGYVPQEHQIDKLFPLTVNDVLKMGVMPSRWKFSTKGFEAKAEKILEILDLLSLRKKLLRELSGGQRQRALIARALIDEPDVLVMDEPHNSLDHQFREKIWKILENYQRERSFSWMVIDHDLNRIINQIDWLCLLGMGRAFCGPVEKILNEPTLSEAYGEPVHVHEENGRFQIHFL